METYEVLKAAIGRNFKAISVRLREKRGWRERFLYRQLEEPKDVRFDDCYLKFLDILEAIYAADKNSGDFLLTDLLVRVQSFSGKEDQEGLLTILADAEREHSDVVRAVLTDKTDSVLQREIIESIVAKQRLLRYLRQKNYEE